jgi:hypothetical protein
MTSHKHTIAGTTEGGLKPNYFSAHNSPRASTCPFSKTVVWIAARPQLFKVHAPPISAMLWDRRSHDLDGVSELTAQIYPFQSVQIRSDLFQINDCDLFQNSRLQNSQVSNFPFFRTSIFWSRRFADTCPSQSMALPLLRGFDLSTRSTVLRPFSRSTVEISFGSLDF